MQPRRAEFLSGVFLITFAVLVFQIVQTRILSVIAWYYLAFFAISVAMLGMTAGAVWVYLKRDRISPGALSTWLSDMCLVTAAAMPVSIMVQFSLITQFVPTASSVFSLVLLMAAMTTPYVFAGIAVSLALTRSPFPVSLVYGVDLLGAALGCAAVVALLDFFDGPTAILVAGLVSAAAALAFARGAGGPERAALDARPLWRRPVFILVLLAILVPLNSSGRHGLKPVMVKDSVETGWRSRAELWNSYSRIVAYRPNPVFPMMWAESPAMPRDMKVEQAYLNIDGAAGTAMPHFDGTKASIDYLKYDLVNLAYHLPGIRKSAVIGVGGGRDVLAAHLFGVEDITGVELNSIFVDMHLSHPVYAPFSGVRTIPGVKLVVDDARSWFAATDQSFDLIQMSMIDTFAATGAGAFTLSENGLYTLEGWRAFIKRLGDRGIFTVSRWYSPSDVSESGRMIALAMASLMDAGVADPRRHIFVATGVNVATLVLSKAPFTPEQLATLRESVSRLQFNVLIDPDGEPAPGIIGAIMAASDRRQLDQVASTAWLDLTVSTDNKPFFFNQLRFQHVPEALPRLWRNEMSDGVLRGNLVASVSLVMILLIATIAVVCTIVLPLRGAVRSAPRGLVGAGTAYFALIGVGFMLAEISLLQYFGVFLGHPIYAMGVCLFSLILSSGIGSLSSERMPLTTNRRIATWGAIVAAYLFTAQWVLPSIFEATTASALPVRIAVSLAVLMPVGFLMGFAFPTGMRLVEAISREPAPWFWGINGATGVLASVVAVMIGIAFGINVTMILAGCCYLLLIPAGTALLRRGRASA